MSSWYRQTFKRKAPKFTRKAFWSWCQERTGPLQGKPYGSSSILIKVALGIHDNVWSWIASKFSATEDDSKDAAECFTRAGLGEGKMWDSKQFDGL